MIAKFTHAVLNRPVTARAQGIGWWYQSQHEGITCTMVLTIAGIMPVKESPEQVEAQLRALEAQKENVRDGV